MSWYEKQYSRVEDSEMLAGTVDFDGWGDDVERWFSNIGFILSVSDFEGSHQAIAEGVASGSIPIILKWEGADEVYPKEWCVESIEEAVERISYLTNIANFEEIELMRIEYVNYIRSNFDISVVGNQWVELIGKN